MHHILRTILEIKNKLDNSTNDEDTPKLFSEENNYQVEDEELPNDKLFEPRVLQMKKSLKYQLF